MRKHPVRKFLGLTVLYAVIIVGIFILQFKTESVLSRTIGSLRISLAQTEKEDNKTALRNQFQVNFRGISFIANENEPIMVSQSGVSDEGTKLVLKSFSQPTELSALFTYTDGSTILFSVSDKTPQAQLTVSVKPAGDNDTLALAYKPETGYSIKEQLSNRLLISSKNNNFSLTASNVTIDHIIFTEGELAASYTSYDPTKRFAFESIIGLPLADSKSYDATIKQVRNDIVTRFTQTISSADPSSLTEQDVIAYVAEMAANGSYDEALDNVPDSFKKGNKRTYLSAPFFDNMLSMNRSLVMQTDKYDAMVANSIDARNLDIFSVDGIADYILRMKRTSRIRTLLSLPATMDKFEPTITQATGILNVYTKLAKNDQPLASLFDTIIDHCTEVITNGCSVENQRITVTDNGAPLSTEQLTTLGATLVAYGTLKNRVEFTDAGYLMVNCAISSPDTLDLHTLSTLYPTLAANNTFYPHTLILGYYGTRAVWAWTSATSITYTKTADGTIDINIDFPLSKTHYVIFNGVPTFHANIEIQKQKFRTDPRFETYNSSGYVYRDDLQTLFIKSRHKSQIELIRLFCDQDSSFVPVTASASGSVTLTPPKPVEQETESATPKSTAAAPATEAKPAAPKQPEATPQEKAAEPSTPDTTATTSVAEPATSTAPQLSHGPNSESASSSTEE